MKRLALLIMLVGCLGACSVSEVQDRDWLREDWKTVEDGARETTVRFYMWGGSAPINKWVDTYVADQVKKRYGVSLIRVPMDAGVFVNKLLAEKRGGRKTGTIDLLWVNGENFKALREADALYGPYAEKCPNFLKYVNKKLASTDFGYPVDGYETPYGWAQFVFEYDGARTKSVPDGFAELREWVRDNPGKFTYPQPPDFTGSAFIRQAFYAVTGGPEQYLGGWDRELFERQAPRLWQYLNDLKPYLWQHGRSHPKSIAEQDTLFARGEVDINMSYHPLHAQGKVQEGVYPKSVRTFVMREGSIFNLHFTAIPANAPNKAGAMVVANFLMSPEAQLSKYVPAKWGDYPAIDLGALPQESRDRFASVDLGSSTLGREALSAVAVPEIPVEYLEALEKGWEEHVR
ncbi:ABC transporter substrate-binding protein [Pseudodesulfovibrio tunisiensis]|uniref:ABC transporter substrate-binding protein n=1 Tax=Pseudodesulfovibrio tunisiensis TaxID=463192 RepID=UPI001FB372CD|nr:ABC transporter substrate-binding protein [Pseudodesulfovibrio tunisiensis]